MRTGIRMEGKATAALPDGGLARGVFSISMTAFTPSDDQPGQKKGFWYLSGNWTITASDPERERPFLLTGVLKGSVPFDIMAENGVMEADVRLQHRGVSHRPGRLPMGAFSGTTKLEGTLTVPFVPPAPVVK